MASNKHNPERRTWRGISYRRGKSPRQAKHVRSLREEAAVELELEWADELDRAPLEV